MTASTLLPHEHDGCKLNVAGTVLPPRSTRLRANMPVEYDLLIRLRADLPTEPITRWHCTATAEAPKPVGKSSAPICLRYRTRTRQLVCQYPYKRTRPRAVTPANRPRRWHRTAPTINRLRADMPTELERWLASYCYTNR